MYKLQVYSERKVDVINSIYFIFTIVKIILDGR